MATAPSGTAIPNSRAPRRERNDSQQNVSKDFPDPIERDDLNEDDSERLEWGVHGFVVSLLRTKHGARLVVMKEQVQGSKALIQTEIRVLTGLRHVSLLRLVSGSLG